MQTIIILLTSCNKNNTWMRKKKRTQNWACLNQCRLLVRECRKCCININIYPYIWLILSTANMISEMQIFTCMKFLSFSLYRFRLRFHFSCKCKRKGECDDDEGRYEMKLSGIAYIAWAKRVRNILLPFHFS